MGDSTMGIGDIFKSKENQELRKRVAELEQMLSPEMRESENVQRRLEEEKKKLADLQAKEVMVNHTINGLNAEIEEAKKVLIETNERVLMQEFGLYEPKYGFENSEIYKKRLVDIRERQKLLIKNKKAATGYTNWTVNSSASQGKKMITDMQKLLLRAFNSECDDVISKVKFNTVGTAEKRITASKDAISKLGTVMGLSISHEYYHLKLQELYLAYEYQVKKQEEKEEQRQIREEMREQAKLQKEIEEARKKIQKDKQHYENALAQAKEKLQNEKKRRKAV